MKAFASILVLALGVGLIHAAESKTSFARKHTLLLVDDHDLLYRSGTERVFMPAVKHGAPLIAEEKQWERAIAWNSVYHDPKTGKYQMWYQAYAGLGSPATHPKTMECVVCYADSADGIAFTKPNLGLFSFRDVKDTNIVLIGNGGYGDRYGCSVVVDPKEPDPQHRYKMAHYDWSQDGAHEYAGLHLAFSPDGIHWTKDPGLKFRTAFGARGMQPPFVGEETYRETETRKGTRKLWLMPYTMSDATDLMFDPLKKRFVIYGKMWLDGPDGTLGWKHGMGRTESVDLTKWSPPQLIHVPDEFDLPMTEFHTTPVFYHSGRYYCLNQLLDRRKDEGGIEIELMTSRDGMDWERNSRKELFLHRSKPGEFDSGSLFSNATPIMLNDEMRFYYGAYGSTAIGGGDAIEGDRQPSGVGLATLPRDRFAGLRPVPLSNQPTLKKPLEHIGQVTFKPLDFTGCTDIMVNADATGGSVSAELLDERGYRVPGFEAAQSVPLKKNALRYRLVWKDKKVSELPAARYLLRVHLRSATLFAVTFR